MAAPAFVNAGAKAAAAQDVTPALPASMAAGAIVILVATCPTANTLSISASGSVGTWTPVSGSPVNVASGEALYVWWGRWQSGTTGPTVHASASDVVCAGTVAYSGCIDQGSPIDIAATGTETTSDTSFSFATGISSTRNNCMAICVASILRDSNTGSVPVMTNASLGSLASRLDYCTNTGAGGGFGLSEGTKATAGTLGTWACTYGASSPKGYITFALIGGKTGVVSATSLSVSDTVAGTASKTGAADSSLTVTQTISGARQLFGAAATSLTDTITVAGVRIRLGVAASSLVVGQTLSGVRTRFGGAASALTVADVVAGVRSRFGAADSSLSVTQAAIGTRTVLGVVTATGIILTQSVTGNADGGSQTVFGTVSPTALVAALAVAGLRTRFGAAPVEIVLTQTLTGAVIEFVPMGSAAPSVGGRVVLPFARGRVEIPATGARAASPRGTGQEG